MEKSSLKEKIAKEFIGDARDYLTRYKTLFEISFSHIGMRSKLTGELLFSAECSLKALILLTSTEEDLQTIYRKLINHDLNKLLNQLPDKEKTECKKHLDDSLMKIKVDGRYQFEAQRKYRTNGVLNDTYYITISNPSWHKKVLTDLEKLLEYAESKVKIWNETFSLSEIDINKEIKELNQISKLHK